MSSQLSAKKRLKAFVGFLQYVLPEGLFNGLYRAAFPAYKGLIREAYLLRGFARFYFSDPDRWSMTRAIHSVMPYSLVGVGGLEATYRLACRARDQEGDFVELGVARGGCAALLGRAMFANGTGNGRKLWLFDSYEGLPAPTVEDFAGGQTGDHVRPLPQGSCLGTLEEVRRLMLDVNRFPEDRIEFVKGWFQDTVPAEKKRIPRIAVLRIDGDWYESTRTCLEGLYGHVVEGGAVIIDDYESCHGARRAVDEFIQTRGLVVKLTMDGRGGCWFLKT